MSEVQDLIAALGVRPLMPAKLARMTGAPSRYLASSCATSCHLASSRMDLDLALRNVPRLPSASMPSTQSHAAISLSSPSLYYIARSSSLTLHARDSAAKAEAPIALYNPTTLCLTTAFQSRSSAIQPALPKLSALTSQSRYAHLA
eukprot:382573-Pleurochrysis_carterae.AAC.1